MNRIYLDHSATTPVDVRVAEAMLPYFSEIYGNPSSIHRFGQETRAAVEKSRNRIAGLLNARESELYFLSGGTEADNLAIQGAARALSSRGKHIITAKTEHKAVLQSCKALEKEGFTVTYLNVDEFGRVDPERVAAAIRNDTILITVMHANNEVGTINLVTEIGRIAKENKILFHTDAVQSFGKIRLDVDELNADLVSISAHKIYGPKGIGALYIRRGTGINKLIHGGSHERNRRAGTENVPGIVGFARAAELASQNLESNTEYMTNLRNYFQEQLINRINGVTVNGHPEQRLCNNLNVSFRDCEAEALLLSLDMAGVAASAGSACSSGSLETSHVLRAMGLPKNRIGSAIRFSLGPTNTREEIDAVVIELSQIVARLRRLKSL